MTIAVLRAALGLSPTAKKFVKSMRIGAKLSQPWTSHAYTKVAPVDEEESSSNSDHLTTSFVTEIDRKYLEPLASNYQKYQQIIHKLQKYNIN